MAMAQVKFGITFSLNDYAYAEVDQFIECAGNISEESNLRQRYIDFLNAVLAKKVKPSTLVDVDVLNLFIGDLDNRAHIDYLEDHWKDDPRITAGGKMFWGRCNKLRAIHQAALS
tara:strand:+ start:1351 stop:1695 length:345 start_codon:yes stop_codon:yes gene_type:complete